PSSHRRRAVSRVRRWGQAALEDGQSRTLVVEGAVGVGKTPFLRELGLVLNLEGYRVLRLRCTNQPGSPIPSLLKAAQALAPDPFAAQPPSTLLLAPRAGPA